MSIASELQNYADGLDDAWDAAEDMGATIPHDRNMVNLDDAIRTIPVSSPNDGVLTITQNGTTVQTFSADQATNVTAALTDTTYTAGTGINISAQNVISATGSTVTTFHWGGSPNYSMYKDSGYTTAATYSDIATAYANGLVYIADGEDEVTYVVVSDIPDAYTITVTGIGLPGYEGGSASYAYASSTWTKTATEFQKKLTAGTNVQINGTTISATDTTYSAFTGATSSVAGTSGLVPAPTTSDPDKFLKGDGTWAAVSGGAPAPTILYHKYDQDDNFDGLYKDALFTEPIWGYEIKSLFQDGEVLIYDSYFPGFLEVNAVLDDDGGYTGVSATYTFASSHYSRAYEIDNTQPVGTPTFLACKDIHIQPKLTAGTNVQISAQNVISATDTTYSAFTGATSSVAGAAGLVPAPAAGDEGKALHGDGTWKDTTAKLVEMSYGESNAWAKFIAAYNAGSIVYCRASSNANPGSGSQTRKAFMAYVNNATSPTSVEFQYVRSVSSKTDSQQGDQVFVYTLTSTGGGTWSVASRNMGPKINVSGPITKTFTTGANATITIGADAMTGATSGAAGAAGIVPKPVAGDQDKMLTGAGTWSNVTGSNMDFSSAAGTAVIKTITDTNGRTGIYFADGTLITTRKVQYVGPIDTAWGTLYEGHTTDYYKFAPTDGDDFVAEPNVQVTLLNNSASGSCWLGAWENSAQIVNGGWAIPAGALCFIRASAYASNITLNLYIQAIGRWK